MFDRMAPLSTSGDPYSSCTCYYYYRLSISSSSARLSKEAWGGCPCSALISLAMKSSVGSAAFLLGTPNGFLLPIEKAGFPKGFLPEDIPNSGLELSLLLPPPTPIIEGLLLEGTFPPISAFELFGSPPKLAISESMKSSMSFYQEESMNTRVRF